MLSHELQLTHNVTISAETRATITGGGSFGLVYVGGGPADPGPTVSLINLNIVQGYSVGPSAVPVAAGVSNFFGRLTISGCHFSGNQSDNNVAGAILNVGGTLAINHCVLTNNSNQDGTTALNNQGTATIRDSYIFGNDGFGSCAIENSGTLTLSGCAFWDNSPIDILGGYTEGGSNTFGQPQQSFFVLSGTALDQAITDGIRQQTVDIGNTNSLTLYDSGGQLLSTLCGEKFNYVGGGTVVSGVAYSSSNLANGTRYTNIIYLYSLTFYDAAGHSVILDAFG